MREWRWIEIDVVIAIHDRQIAEHGGGDGIRDLALVESALARPKNIALYEQPDAAALAAAFCYGLIKNHGFVDGNKRTGWIIARLFLADNDVNLIFDQADAVLTVEGVAAGRIDEVSFAQWLRERIVPR